MRAVRRSVLALLCVLVGLGAVPPVTAVAGTAGAGEGQVIEPSRPVPGWRVPVPHVRGRWLVDRSGRVMVLHGENMISKYAPYTYQSLGFSTDDLQFLRGEGMDSIRLGFIWKALEPRPGHFDDHYLNSVVSMVHQAEAAGQLVVLDFHQDALNEAFKGEGFPDWALDPTYMPLGYPAGLSPEWQAFMADRPAPDGLGVQEHLAAAWRHVATRLRGDRSVIFEPFNEPYPFAPEEVAMGCLQPLGCPVSDRTRLYPLSVKLLHAIRAVDRTRPVFFEPWYSFDYGVRSWLPRFHDSQVGFAPHIYCPTGGAGLVQPPAPVSAVVKPCPTVFSIAYRNVAFHEHTTGEPTLVTEFGAGGSRADHEAVEAGADRQLIGWFHWAYWSQDGGRPQTYALLKDIHRGPVKGNVNLDQLDAITRPYPRLIAGTPESWSYRDGVFQLDYTTTRVGGGAFGPAAQTEIVLPSRHYLHGYRIHIRGGRVLSKPGSPLLVVTARPGVNEVNVRVTPVRV